MAGPGLPTNIASGGTTTGHKAHSDASNAIVNQFDTTLAATSGHVPVGDGTVFDNRALLSTDIPTVEKNTQTGTSYSAVSGDAGKVIERDNASANTTTFGSMPAGTVIGICQIGAGASSIVASGITINSRGGLLTLAGQWAEATIRYRTTTAAVLSGDLV